MTSRSEGGNSRIVPWERDGLGTSPGNWWRILAVVLLMSSYPTFVAWLLFLHAAEVVVTADLHAERVSYRVMSPRNAVFLVGGMRGGAAGRASDPAPLQGSFEPNLNSEVTFGRVGVGPVEIDVSPPPGTGDVAGRLDRDDAGVDVDFIGQTHFESIPTSDGYHPIAPRFPIWGEARTGEAMHPPSDAGRAEASLLIDGSLRVSARSLVRGSIYPLTSIAVPVGAEVGTSGESRREVLWWGVAYVDPQRTALVVELSTEAPVIALRRPNRTKADLIRVSALGQLLNDPDILGMQLLFSIVVFSFLNSDRIKKLFEWTR